MDDDVPSSVQGVPRQNSHKIVIVSGCDFIGFSREVIDL
jgi:hypothetical protein